MSSSGLPSRKTWAYWREPSEGPQRQARDWTWLMQGQVERAGTVQPGGKKVQGRSYQCVQIPERGGTKRIEPGFAQ